jgi:hypothetical protein
VDPFHTNRVFAAAGLRRAAPRIKHEGEPRSQALPVQRAAA